MFTRYSSNGIQGALRDVPKDVFDALEIIAGDLRDPSGVNDAIAGRDVVFHLAAHIGIPYSYVHPIDVLQVNVDGTGNVLEACRRNNVEKLVVFSTSETYGTALESLRWGDAHQATHDHQVLGEVPLLRYFVNIRQSTSGGDHTLMRGLTKGGDGPQPFLNVHGAGYRGVYDFADPDSSVFVISTGQSGHFLSRHYDDLGERWRRGEYIPMSLDLDLARAAAVGVTQLVPR